MKSAYLDGELCAVRPDGASLRPPPGAPMDEGLTDELRPFVFHLLYLEGESTADLPLIDGKERLRTLLASEVRTISKRVVRDDGE